jgi:hypothetical protein
MKTKIQLALTTLILSTLTQTAFAEEPKNAGLFLEPALTYQQGEMKVTYPYFNDSTEKTNGFGLGLRLGFHVYDSFFVAADGRYGKLHYDSSALGGSANAETSNLGLTVGAQTPLAGVRVWGTYVLTGGLNPDAIGSTIPVDVKFNNPKGYRVGAGVYIAMVSLNLEYQELKYDSTTLEKAGPITGNSDDVKGTDKQYILSVSFPVAL